MGKHKRDDELDAFGHLEWTVGNSDWIACFDAIRKADMVEYHVVVDSDSGGFTDTIEHDRVPATEQGVQILRSLPSYWADICRAQYSEEEEERYNLSDDEVAKTEAQWNAHLTRLLQEQSDGEGDEGDEGDEVWWDEHTLRSWRP